MPSKQEVVYNKPWILQRADPYVIKHKDGFYYFTVSVPAYDCIILRCAKSLWELKDAEEHIIWKKHGLGMMSQHIWAIRPYVLECEGQNPLTDEWIERGKMQPAREDTFSFEAFSLDATAFENKGKYYYVWVEKVGVGKQISNLYIAEMER